MGLGGSHPPLTTAPPFEGLSKPPCDGTPYHNPPYTEEAPLCLERALAHNRYKDPHQVQGWTLRRRPRVTLTA
jgi:hypothetical protein